jgi:hypothetical protein
MDIELREANMSAWVVVASDDVNHRGHRGTRGKTRTARANGRGEPSLHLARGLLGEAVVIS